MQTLKVISTTAPQLMTLAAAKDHLRIDGSDEDLVVAGMVAAVTDYLNGPSGILGVALLDQTWRLTLSESPVGLLNLGISPVKSITSIKYFDQNDVEQTFLAANYRLVDASVELVSGASWPSVSDREIAFWVDFEAGYGGNIPQKTIFAAKLLLGDMYTSRTASGDVQQVETPIIGRLLTSSRSYRSMF